MPPHSLEWVVCDAWARAEQPPPLFFFLPNYCLMHPPPSLNSITVANEWLRGPRMGYTAYYTLHFVASWTKETNEKSAVGKYLSL